MKHKCIVIFIIAVFFISGCNERQDSLENNNETITEQRLKQPVKLVFTSWRMEDINRMNTINQVFMEKHPGINIQFQPSTDQEYNVQLLNDLEIGNGADIMYLRSYDAGRAVYTAGHLLELNTYLPKLEYYPETPKQAWSTEQGILYAVPSVGVTHGIFYHKTIFEKYNLSEPETWDEFITLCDFLKEQGETVIAQGTIDEWTLYEVVFSGLGANFYGGEKARQALLRGEKKLTDPEFLEAFKMIQTLSVYFPENPAGIDYFDMIDMFAAGQAALFIGGSWEVSVFHDLGVTDLGWFPPPVLNKGDRLQYCFHVDAGIGVNKKSKHLEEALIYLKWTTTEEYATLVMNLLPGFFSYTPGEYTLNDPLAEKILSAAKDADLTVRTVWEKLSQNSPSGNTLMGEILPQLARGEVTPFEAAEYIQTNLESWYEPFQK